MKLIEIIKELKVEVSKPNIFQAVVAKQYDMNTRFIKATFVDGTDIIYIPSGPTIKAIINAERPDGQSKGFDGVVNDDGTVTVPLHSWMLEKEGSVICDISIIDTEADDNKKLTTTAFTLLVEKAAFGGSDITNDPQFDVLVALLEAAPTAQQSLEVSNQALELSQEANSKYDACVEATDNANNVLQYIQAGGYIESLKEINNGSKFCVWVGSTAEYAALEEKRQNCLYILTDEMSPEDILRQINEIQDALARQHREILKNEEDITKNKAAILQNEEDIAKNTATILNHENNITKNSKSISDVQTALASDKNSRFKTLWSDSSGGVGSGNEISLNGSGNYKLFTIHIATTGVSILAIRDQQYIRGSSSIVTDSSVGTVVKEYIFMAEVTDNDNGDEDWTVKSCSALLHKINSTHGSELIEETCTSIKGIL